MKVINLTQNSKYYTCNAYLILGDMNAISDVNTLIDAGSDIDIIKEIPTISTGVGKKMIENIIITHFHSDHTKALKSLKETFDAKVYAYSPFEGVDFTVKDGQMIKIGDSYFEVIHTPGHSNDSICFYSKAEGVLFSGDTPIKIISSNGTYEEDFVKAIKKISKLNIETIYPGHGPPITENCNSTINISLENVIKGIK